MSATFRKFLAQLIVFVVALPHLAGVALALWLDEEVVKTYLDGLVKARRELDPAPYEETALRALPFSRRDAPLRDRRP